MATKDDCFGSMVFDTHCFTYFLLIPKLYAYSDQEKNIICTRYKSNRWEKKKKIYFEQTGKKNMISQCMILLMELSDSTCTHLLHIIILSVRFVRALCSAADREWTREVQHAFAFPSENSMT